ncbi:MAG: histone deacetylase family protein [Dongiaceae bacterium]
MTTAFFTHAACLDHDTGPGHPERAQRLEAILLALDEPEFAMLDRREAPLADIAQITRVHDKGYAQGLLSRVPQRGWVALEGDTLMSPGSGEAALRAAGAMIAAVDLVLKNGAANAFCAVRPPGHHAESDMAMGFCLFNNVAIGAAHACAVYGLKRVAIIDFDVHHGNGTQHIFEHDAQIFYASTHQMPLYPGTGARVERGVGNICNAPLPPFAGGDEFRDTYEEIVLPAIDRFGPELIMISAGFDAHRADPLASLELEAEDFGWVTERLVEMAAAHCGGRLVSTLEGGYDLEALAESSAAHVAALLAAKI